MGILLLIGIAISLIILASLTLVAAFQWLMANPIGWMGVAIACGIGYLVNRQMRLDKEENEAVDRIMYARQRPQRKAKPEVKEQGTSQAYAEIHDSLMRVGYSASEAKMGAEYAINSLPEGAAIDRVLAAIHHLSDEKVGIIR